MWTVAACHCHRPSLSKDRTQLPGGRFCSSYTYQISNFSPKGVVLLVMAVPLQTWVGKQFGKLRVRTAGKTDRRIRLMNEIVNGMKVIKMYTWEKPFANLVHESREEEIGVVRNTSYYRAFNFSFFFSASRFILLCTFLVFGFTGEVLHLFLNSSLQVFRRCSLLRKPSCAFPCSTQSASP